MAGMDYKMVGDEPKIEETVSMNGEASTEGGGMGYDMNGGESKKKESKE
jgi:hypothetical protein